jgi:hypothetical protein
MRKTFVIALTIVLAALCLITPCKAQDRAKVDPGMTAAVVGRVLAKAGTSGSLVYHGQCQEHGGKWDLPVVSFPKRFDDTPVQMLQEMFADNPEMQVTRDANGNIRMSESDVPRDFLDLRIVQVLFSSGSDKSDTANEALSQIMVTPEVRNYMTVNHLGPIVPDFRRLIGPVQRNAPIMSGDLYFVTFSQALDYILKTYPGFWAYEDCPGENGSRTVFLQFFPTVSERVVALP